MTDGVYCITTRSPEETHSFGRRLGEVLEPGLCVGLTGPVGAGKTRLVKGIAAGASVPRSVMVNSPTFVIVNEYPGRLILYHVDAYRLHGVAELAAVGFGEMIRSDGAVIVEWADRVAAAMPDDHLAVRMDHVDETTRRITLHASGEMSRRALSVLSSSP